MPNKRQMAWFDKLAEEQSVAAGGTVGLQLDSDMIDADKRGCTVARVIMTLHVRPTLIDLGQMCTFGITMVHEDVTNLPDPEAGTDQPGWIVRDQIRVIAHDLEDGVTAITRVTYDLRASRKYPTASNELLLIVHNNLGGGSAIIYDALTRVLCWMG